MTKPEQNTDCPPPYEALHPQGVIEKSKRLPSGVAETGGCDDAGELEVVAVRPSSWPPLK